MLGPGRSTDEAKFRQYAVTDPQGVKARAMPLRRAWNTTFRNIDGQLYRPKDLQVAPPQAPGHSGNDPSPRAESVPEQQESAATICRVPWLARVALT